jgi:hypothetical protein
MFKILKQMVLRFCIRMFCHLAKRSIMPFEQRRDLSGLIRNNLKMPGAVTIDRAPVNSKKYLLLVCLK